MVGLLDSWINGEEAAVSSSIACKKKKADRQVSPTFSGKSYGQQQTDTDKKANIPN